jgi:hypothetical protein
MAYVSRIAKAASRQVRVESFGTTGQGRDLLAVIVSKDNVFDPVHSPGESPGNLHTELHSPGRDGWQGCFPGTAARHADLKVAGCAS